MSRIESSSDWQRQRTIREAVRIGGRGYLSGAEVTLEFRPAAANTGIVFIRTDLPGSPPVPATVDHVVPRQRRTAIACGEAVVEMVEHVMAALAGLAIDNCVVAIDGPETPGCDGSSLDFVKALRRTEIVTQSPLARVITIDRNLRVNEGEMSISIEPSSSGQDFSIEYELNYPKAPVIGRQRRVFDLGPGAFELELAPARTFVLDHEAEMLKAAGIGRHCTAQDLLIFGPDGPIENTLRFSDEPVRHKMLDVLGDLALAGQRIHGRVTANRSGHSLNAALVRRIFDAGIASSGSSSSGRIGA
ncbi:UDP-3-O-[3-hydroxymyristoyl] N-acetylglucosamine deacetylase [bacterium]|nr:UDP-3-O-[3-hydroxymyristoyl] N-acetylglucosamine deacetylase [bacterium]